VYGSALLIADQKREYKKMKYKYFELWVKWEKGDEWSQEFGDFRRDVVLQEIEDEYSDVYSVQIKQTYEEKEED